MHVFVSSPKETNKCIPLPDAASESHDPNDPTVRDRGPTCRNKLGNIGRCSVYQNSGKQLHYHRIGFNWDCAALKADPLLFYEGVHDLLTQIPCRCSLNDLGGTAEPSPTCLDLRCNIILAVCLNRADRIALTVLASRQVVPNGSGFAVLSALEYEIEAAVSSAVYSFIFFPCSPERVSFHTTRGLGNYL